MFNRRDYSALDGSWSQAESTTTSFSKEEISISDSSLSDDDITTSDGEVVYLVTEGTRNVLTNESKSVMIIIGYIGNWVKNLLSLDTWTRHNITE